MPLLATDAVVLHLMDYLESSRIIRLATREAGVQSVLAKGARRPKSRFGTALDLFSEGEAQILTRPGRDLQTLSGFDVTRARSALGEDIGRFTGASALAELMLRFGSDDTQPGLYDTLVASLDELSTASAASAREVAIGACWRLIAALGFAPSLDACSGCHAVVPPSDAVLFHHRAGGVLCARCARAHPGGRAIPSAALEALRGWFGGTPSLSLAMPDARAHQRLLREFVREHLADGRPLRAFEAWEEEAGVAATGRAMHDPAVPEPREAR